MKPAESKEFTPSKMGLVHPLRRYLDRHGLSPEQFVTQKKVNLSVSFIRQVCKGEREPSRVTAKVLSDVTGIPLEVLMFPGLEERLKHPFGLADIRGPFGG